MGLYIMGCPMRHFDARMGSLGTGKDSLSSLPATGLGPSLQVAAPHMHSMVQTERCSCRITFPSTLSLTSHPI